MKKPNRRRTTAAKNTRRAAPKRKPARITSRQRFSVVEVDPQTFHAMLGGALDVANSAADAHGQSANPSAEMALTKAAPPPPRVTPFSLLNDAASDVATLKHRIDILVDRLIGPAPTPEGNGDPAAPAPAGLMHDVAGFADNIHVQTRRAHDALDRLCTILP